MNRLKRLFLTLAVAVMGAVTLNAQEHEAVVPIEEDILAKTLDTTSPYYYTNLMLKYNLGKEPLTEMEYYYLYYGYTYQEAYNPFAKNSALDAMLAIMAEIDPEQPSVWHLENIVERGAEAMEVDPFNPKMLNMLAYAYGALGDERRERLYFDHLNGILRAIELSGTGLKENEAWHVLMFSHAYDMVASKGYSYGEARIISRTTEFIPLLRKQDGIKGFYIDYSRVYRNKPDDVTFQRDRTWQFNGLKPQEYK
jgi:hypothetical protein